MSHRDRREAHEVLGLALVASMQPAAPRHGEEINFRAVARRASVSLDFVYAHTDLRKRIEILRGQQRTEDPPPPQAPSADDATVIHTLTETLCRERTTPPRACPRARTATGRRTQ